MININSTYLSLNISFEKEVKNTYKIDNINNYKIVSCKTNEKLEILSIDVEDKNYINEIIITVRDCKNNERHKLYLNKFKFEYNDGNIEETTEFEYTSRSEMPRVLKVVSTSSINMIVHFTKEMNFNKDILNLSRYNFVNSTLKVLKVEKDTQSSIKLLTTKQQSGKLYQLKVI